jgi:SAM-dependent methyltransferase
LFSDQPLPAETKALMPGMVSFHKTPVRVVFELIRLAEMGSEDVFFDIGSGLGQVVLLVNLITGARCMGIEYEPAYCAYASAIASRLRLADTEFINADAGDGDYSKGTVFFLYTPFEGRLLQDMLRLLEKESRQRALRIFTYGPCSARVAAENWCSCVNGIPVDPYRLCLFVRSGQPVYR